MFRTPVNTGTVTTVWTRLTHEGQKPVELHSHIRLRELDLVLRW